MDRLPRAQRLAELLIGAVRDHLVGIGIGRRSRTGLEDVDHEVLVELSFLHLFGCVLNRVGEAGLEQPQLGIDQRGRALDLGQGANEAAGESQAADWEILSGALGAGAVVGVRWDPDLAHRVLFHAYPILGHRRHPNNRLASSNLNHCRPGIA